MEIREIADNGTPGTVQCPECEFDIPIDMNWQEADVIACPNCPTELQVVSLEPVLVDFAPKTRDGWVKTRDLEPLALDEVEALEEAEEEGLDNSQTWTGPVPRHVATLRSLRARPLPRRDPEEVMDADATYLTPEGDARLRAELEHLKTVRLPRVIAWLGDALSEGFEDEDVTELEEARSELSLIEGRIRSLENVLASVEYLPEPGNTETVEMGSWVTVVEGNYEPETYRIVSPAEADPLDGFISYVSPLGKALMGHRAGDQVVISAPDGAIEFRIVKIGL